MGEMKSAYERAMERVAKLEKPSEEETLKWKYAPEGQRLAAEYLKEEGNLVAELGKYQEAAKGSVVKGAEEIFLRTIVLPANDSVKQSNKRAMEGIKITKRDKAAVENVFSRIRRLFEHYEKDGEQQKRQAYEMLKQNLEAKIQQAVQQQGGLPPGAKISVESQPQFQEEWRRTLAQLDSQYHKLLDEYKQEISAVS